MPLHSTTRRQAATSLAALLGLGWAVPASALTDLLRTPARQSALAPRMMMLGVALAGERLVAVGERGLIIWSDDAGERWTQAEVPVSATLTAVSFVDARYGWAVGHDGVVLHSADAGQTWRLQFDGLRANSAILAARLAAVPAAKDEARREQAQTALADEQALAGFGPSRPLLGLWWRNASLGWVFGAFGQLFTTQDGGLNWAYRGDALPNPDGLHLNSMTSLPDGTLAITAEAGKVFRSRDEGRNWTLQDTGYNGHLYGLLAGPAPGVLIAYGFAGKLFRSVDDGQRWQSVPRLSSKSFVGGLRLASGRLVLIDRERHVYTSDDSGNSWHSLPVPPGRALAGTASRLLRGSLPVAGLGGAGLLALEPAR